jgi:DNA-binding transcriptional ArsR family regulator
VRKKKVTRKIIPRIAMVEGVRCVGPTLTPLELLRLKEAIHKESRSREFQSQLKLLQLLSGRIRFKILHLLYERPLCVCDLAEILDESVSNISHQIRALKGAGWVKGDRKGRAIEYRLTDPSRDLLERIMGLPEGRRKSLRRNDSEEHSQPFRQRET